MPVKHTNETIDLKLKEIAPNIVRVGQYVGLLTKMSVECTLCFHIWAPIPKVILRRTGGTNCPNCTNIHRQLTDTEIQRRLVDRNIIALGEYKGALSPLQWQCIHNHTWFATPASVINLLTGCPHCANNIKYTQEQIINKLKLINPDLQILSTYSGMMKLAKFMCPKNHTWNTSVSNILHHKARCPVCYPYAPNKQFGIKTVVDDNLFKSRVEAEVYIFLKQYTANHSLTLQLQKKYDNTRKSCDFYIPETKTWIEISSFSNQKYLQKIKWKRQFVSNINEHFIFASSVDNLIIQLEHQQ